MDPKDLTEMYHQENTHWWFHGKRDLLVGMYKKYLCKGPLLDVGCGTGIILKEFGKFTEVYGVDAAPTAIKFCKKRGLKNVILGRSDKISFESKKFSTIIASDLLEHVDDVKTIREVRRLLKKDGKFIITVPALMMLWSKHDEVLYHKRRYTKKELVRKLEKNGFIIEKISYWNSTMLPMTYLYKKLKQGNNTSKSGRFTNSIFYTVLRFENALINKINFPIGVSLVCVARKK
jgi:2-polyprenyl-3-methyl-5-hydroxy-6-metoxy-1,4-benzoquinol methylase